MSTRLWTEHKHDGLEGCMLAKSPEARKDEEHHYGGIFNPGYVIGFCIGKITGSGCESIRFFCGVKFKSGESVGREWPGKKK